MVQQYEYKQSGCEVYEFVNVNESNERKEKERQRQSERKSKCGFVEEA